MQNNIFSIHKTINLTSEGGVQERKWIRWRQCLHPSVAQVQDVAQEETLLDVTFIFFFFLLLFFFLYMSDGG